MRVLVVDDNQDGADSLAAVLRLWGHEARVAYDGRTGLVIASRFKPELTLLDVEMPKVHGGDVARELRRQPGFQGHIVAMSANDPEDSRLAPFSSLFDAYLVKPCNFEQLQALIGDWRFSPSRFDRPGRSHATATSLMPSFQSISGFGQHCH
jgi:DNA-binding response OmpR family regulator